MSKHFFRYYSFTFANVIINLVHRFKNGLGAGYTTTSPLDARVSYIGEYDVEVNEGITEMTLAIDVPGAKKEDIDIEFLPQGLQVTATRKGIRGGPRCSVFGMGNDVDRDSITTNLEDGVLYIKLKRVA